MHSLERNPEYAKRQYDWTMFGREEGLAQLLICRQPEERHRARYLSEGSRGAIKDRSGSSHCTIQLVGHHRPVRVEIYAAKIDGVTAHPNYRLVPVGGKAATPCREIPPAAHCEGVGCVEVELRPESNMTAILDSIGVLKVCEQPGTSNRKKKRDSQQAGDFTASEPRNNIRLAFRACIPRWETGKIALSSQPPSKSAFIVLHQASEPIHCVQQLGAPEILKLSLSCSPARGGVELFIIGRNFDNNSKVLFREYAHDGRLKWSSEALVDRQYLHQCHLVCTVPVYPQPGGSKHVSLAVACGSRLSHSVNFHYLRNVGEEGENECDDWRPPDIASMPAPFQGNVFSSKRDIHKFQNHPLEVIQGGEKWLTTSHFNLLQAPSPISSIGNRPQNRCCQEARPTSSSHAYDYDEEEWAPPQI